MICSLEIEWFEIGAKVTRILLVVEFKVIILMCHFDTEGEALWPLLYLVLLLGWMSIPKTC